MFCSSCGKQIVNLSEYCSGCGKLHGSRRSDFGSFLKIFLVLLGLALLVVFIANLIHNNPGLVDLPSK